MKRDFILGVFLDRTNAEAAISKLENLGYDPKEISVVVKDTVVAEKIEATTGTNVASGAAEGATTGGVVGGVLGLLVGIGAITIPGIGAVLIGGPLAAALGLTGAAATALTGATTGVVAGGVLGALVGLGMPEEAARYYDEQLREGAVLLAVSPKSEVSEETVRQVFVDSNAQQVQYLR